MCWQDLAWRLLESNGVVGINFTSADRMAMHRNRIVFKISTLFFSNRNNGISFPVTVAYALSGS